VGNFQKGDRAVVTLMSYPDTPLQGSVDSIGWALPSKTVAPAVQNECTQLSSMKGRVAHLSADDAGRQEAAAAMRSPVPSADELA
jgi:hypothetical protein